MPDDFSERRRIRPPKLLFSFDRARNVIGLAETVLYMVVGLLLFGAGALILVDTGTGIVDGIRLHQAASELGVRLLDRVLLLLIVAELLFTLQLVIARGEIAAEPFLFIGIIAVVRRVVVITAQLENLPQQGRALTNFLFELGLLALLVMAFGVAIFLIRRGAAAERAAQGAGGAGE
jgi:uncharacterized membrane protein (DUF373 family)